MKNKLFIYPLLLVSYKNVMVKYRKFDCENANIIKHLEKIGSSFLDGYHEAIKTEQICLNERSLSMNGNIYEGFKFEGAAMGFMLNDLLRFGTLKRIKLFITNNPKHIYMLHIGAGWALAKVPFVNFLNQINQFDNLYKWMLVDGFGFHQAYFQTNKYVHNQIIPKKIKGQKLRSAYFQGVGRALWFVFGGQALKIKKAINKFEMEYQADLWSGTGLAAAYAGGVSKKDLERLKKVSQKYEGEIAQGVAFACKARIRAGILVKHTSLAAEILANCSPSTAAMITDETLKKLNGRGNETSYFNWQKAIISHFNKRLKHESILD